MNDLNDNFENEEAGEALDSPGRNQAADPSPSGQPTSDEGNSYWSTQEARRAQQQNRQLPPEQPAQQTPPEQPVQQQPPQQQQNNTYRQGYYPPYQNQQGGYGPYGAQRPQAPYPGSQQQQPPQQQPYNPYQYNPNSGWQQPPAQPEQKYEWNFQDYDKLDKKKDGRKKNKGLVVFVVCLLCVLSVGMISVATYAIFGQNIEGGFVDDGLGEGWPEDGLFEGDSGAADSPIPTDENIQLELATKPPVSETFTADGPMTIPEIAKAVGPSVVGVSAYTSSQFFEPIQVGSGIIMTESGYVITNAHVVSGGTDFKVQLYDNTPYDAVLIGADADTDLAILKVEADNLIAATFGDSDEIEVGETVIAIGNPSGLELAGSVTRGIVSAVNREVRTSTYAMNYIQTDAAINPGNSGGALVNEYGQVIGINSAKIMATGYEGIGFAIPITDAKPILDDIIQNGRVTGRAMLGIACEIVDEVDARNYNIPMGIMIQEVYTTSDLYNKDVQKKDILTHINGERVYDLTDVQGIIKQYKAGDELELTFYRRLTSTQNTEFTITAKLIENES